MPSREFIFLVVIFLAVSPGSRAEILSSPSVKILLETADVICTVSPEDITSSSDGLGVAFRKAMILRGSANEPLKVFDLSGLWPNKKKKYVLFLKKKGSDLIPATKLNYAIGFESSIPISNKTVSNPDNFFRFLAEALSRETVPAAAALQASLLNSAPANLTQELWKTVNTNTSTDPYVLLSAASLGLKVDGASVLRKVPQCPPIQQSEIATDGFFAHNFFLEEINGLTSVWMQTHASVKNKKDILYFASKQGPQLAGAALTAIATKLSTEDIPVVVEIYKRPDNSWETSYACLRALARILDKSEMIPTMDEFQAKRDEIARKIFQDIDIQNK